MIATLGKQVVAIGITQMIKFVMREKFVIDPRHHLRFRIIPGIIGAVFDGHAVFSNVEIVVRGIFFTFFVFHDGTIDKIVSRQYLPSRQGISILAAHHHNFFKAIAACFNNQRIANELVVVNKVLGNSYARKCGNRALHITFCPVFYVM